MTNETRSCGGSGKIFLIGNLIACTVVHVRIIIVFQFVAESVGVDVLNFA